MITAALAHEKEHVKRLDAWTTLLAEWNRAFYWFHPLAWFLRHRLSTLAETACDDAVIASCTERSDYAGHLLRIAERLTRRPSRLVLPGEAMARTPRIERRINNVLDCSRTLSGPLSIEATLVIVIIALPVAVLAAGLTPSGEDTVAPAKTEASKTASVSERSVQQASSTSTAFTAGPIRELKSENGGRAFEFPINVPKGRKLGVSFGEWPISNVGPVYSRREKELEGPATATLELNYTNSSTAERRDDVLLSNEQWMEFRLRISGCFPPAVTHIAGVPLSKTPAPEKKVILIPESSPLAKAPSGIRLLLIVRKDQNPKTSAEVEKIKPRGELIVSLEPIERPKPQPTLQQRFAESWRRSESGIGTFFVRYQHLMGPRSWFKALDPLAVHRIIDQAASRNLKPNYGSSDTDIEQSHAFATEVLQALLSDEQLKLMAGKPVKLAQSDFRMVGMKTLNVDGTRDGEEPWMVRLFDGDVDLDYVPANRQLNILGPDQSRIHRTGLNDFRSLMNTLNLRVNDIEGLLSKASAKELPSGRVLIQHGGIELVANTENGFVERFSLLQGSNLLDETLQFGSKEFPGKVTFPRSKFDFQYQEGKLRSVGVFTNDELRLNEGFSDKEFTLRLPPGVVVVDYRKSDFRPSSIKVETEIPDAAAYAKAHAGTKTPR